MDNEHRLFQADLVLKSIMGFLNCQDSLNCRLVNRKFRLNASLPKNQWVAVFRPIDSENPNDFLRFGMCGVRFRDRDSFHRFTQEHRITQEMDETPFCLSSKTVIIQDFSVADHEAEAFLGSVDRFFRMFQSRISTVAVCLSRGRNNEINNKLLEYVFTCESLKCLVLSRDNWNHFPLAQVCIGRLSASTVNELLILGNNGIIVVNELFRSPLYTGNIKKLFFWDQKADEDEIVAVRSSASSQFKKSKIPIKLDEMKIFNPGFIAIQHFFTVYEFVDLKHLSFKFVGPATQFYVSNIFRLLDPQVFNSLQKMALWINEDIAESALCIEQTYENVNTLSINHGMQIRARSLFTSFMEKLSGLVETHFTDFNNFTGDTTEDSSIFLRFSKHIFERESDTLRTISTSASPPFVVTKSGTEFNIVPIIGKKK